MPSWWYLPPFYHQVKNITFEYYQGLSLTKKIIIDFYMIVNIVFVLGKILFECILTAMVIYVIGRVFKCIVG